MRYLLIIVFSFLFTSLFAQEKRGVLLTPFEQDDNHTATYEEAIVFYKKLAKMSSFVQMVKEGQTDSGEPLYSVVISDQPILNRSTATANNKVVLLVNNAIHAGEPCGVDASMMLARELATTHKSLLEETVVVIIPFYNVGGVLNRNSYTRANQNGPESYGFRGNARNYDLNRDFIKCDTENAKSFAQIYQKWNPDVFVDNHTSNGADYPYTLTLIPTQSDKLPSSMKKYMDGQMLPSLFNAMKKTDWEMTPYVYARTTPDEGIAAFLDAPRYSSGYAALHFAYSFMPETHMLKTFSARVRSTHAFMHALLTHMKDNKSQIILSRADALTEILKSDSLSINWALDQSKSDSLLFKGYTATTKKSKVTGMDRLFYDHEQPYEKNIPFYRYYQATKSVSIPKAYIIPQSYRHLVELMQLHGVKVETLTKDQTLDIEQYKIVDFKSSSSPYEGHYLHSNVSVEKYATKVIYKKGDFLISTAQDAIQYIVHVLEPQAKDSFFAWNFFDSILQQKEHFSAYVFEDLAWDLLQVDGELKKLFEDKKGSDADFAKNPDAQLDFIYHLSPHYEKTHRVYPVGRVVE